MPSIRSSRRAAAAAAALAVALAACAPAEPTAPTGTPSDPIANVDANSSYMIAQENARASLYDWTTTQDATKMQAARAVADLDGDGVVDAVVAPGFGLEQNASVPMRFYKGTAGASGTVTLTDNTSAWLGTPAPNVNHGRKIILGDFNGDNVKDVFVCAHGYDAPPFPGTRNFLLLSGGGKWAVALGQPWSLYVGFHHGCASGDLNNDGDLDILVLDSMGISYVLINDGTGNFMQGRAGIPADLKTQQPVFSVEVLDLDRDGYNDFIVGGAEQYQPTVIYWGEGTGYFADTRANMLPAVPGWQNPLSFAAGDIDGDGTTEVVVTRTKGNAGEPGFYAGFYVQVLRLTGRTPTDVTASIASTLNASAPTVIHDGMGTPTWIEWVWLADYDADGKKDLIGSMSFLGKFWAKNTGSSFGGWTKLP